VPAQAGCPELDQRIIAITHPQTYFRKASDPFFFHIERAHLKWDQKNSLIETRSSGVKGVALGNVSLANRIKSGAYFDSRIADL
jgi:hypothetical protein